MPFFVQMNFSALADAEPRLVRRPALQHFRELVVEPDEEKSKEEVKALGETMKENMVCSNLYPEMKSAVTSPDLKGYRFLDFLL